MTAMSARPLLLLLLAPIIITSCRSSSENGSRTVGDRGQTVIQGEELTTGGLLLDALVHRMPYMQVTRPTGSCPVVNLRGQRLGRPADNVAVYVDGTRMRDTCVLLQILSSDVDRVELYSVSGGRPDGFRPGPGGLIVVYRRR